MIRQILLIFFHVRGLEGTWRCTREFKEQICAAIKEKVSRIIKTNSSTQQNETKIHRANGSVLRRAASPTTSWLLSRHLAWPLILDVSSDPTFIQVLISEAGTFVLQGGRLRACQPQPWRLDRRTQVHRPLPPLNLQMQSQEQCATEGELMELIRSNSSWISDESKRHTLGKMQRAIH